MPATPFAIATHARVILSRAASRPTTRRSAICAVESPSMYRSYASRSLRVSASSAPFGNPLARASRRAVHAARRTSALASSPWPDPRSATCRRTASRARLRRRPWSQAEKSTSGSARRNAALSLANARSNPSWIASSASSAAKRHRPNRASTIGFPSDKNMRPARSGSSTQSAKKPPTVSALRAGEVHMGVSALHSEAPPRQAGCDGRGLLPRPGGRGGGGIQPTHDDASGKAGTASANPGSIPSSARRAFAVRGRRSGPTGGRFRRNSRRGADLALLQTSRSPRRPGSPPGTIRVRPIFIATPCPPPPPPHHAPIERCPTAPRIRASCPLKTSPELLPDHCVRPAQPRVRPPKREGPSPHTHERPKIWQWKGIFLSPIAKSFAPPVPFEPSRVKFRLGLPDSEPFMCIERWRPAFSAVREEGSQDGREP